MDRDEGNPSRAALSHGDLERRVDATIRVLAEDGRAPTSELNQWSLVRKLDVLSNLIAASAQHVRFNVGDGDTTDVCTELIQVLRKADEIYRGTLAEPSLIRSHLWRHYPDDLPAQVMDVSDYLAYAECVLDEFFLVADPVM